MNKAPRETLEQEAARLKRALQHIADLPPPERQTRPYKRSPQRIAIAALRTSTKRNATLRSRGAKP